MYWNRRKICRKSFVAKKKNYNVITDIRYDTSRNEELDYFNWNKELFIILKILFFPPIFIRIFFHYLENIIYK